MRRVYSCDREMGPVARRSSNSHKRLPLAFTPYIAPALTVILALLGIGLLVLRCRGGHIARRVHHPCQSVRRMRRRIYCRVRPDPGVEVGRWRF